MDTFNKHNMEQQIAFTFSAGFPYEYQEMIRRCEDIRQDKLTLNQKRRKYYDGKMSLKSLGIAIPPKLEKMDMAIDWGKKAVEALAQRSKFDGYSTPNEEVGKVLAQLEKDSNLKQKYKIALNDQLVYGCSFITLSLGGTDEPEYLLGLHSAESAAVVWNYRKERVAYGLTIVDYDKYGHPIECNLYTDDAIINLQKLYSGIWMPTFQYHSAGRPLIEVLRYKPTSTQLGHSRITRSVMSTIDCAIREMVRGEIAQEFNTSPQKVLIGAEKEVAERIMQDKWKAYLGAWTAVTGADVKQLAQGTITNHTNYIRSLAARFSGETNVPVSTLGVMHDQQASKEAIEASYTELIAEAEELNDNNRVALQNIALMAVAIANKKKFSDLTEEERDIIAQFKNPVMYSIAQTTDAAVKLASVMDGFANTQTFLEMIGFAEDERRKLTQELTKAKAVSDLDTLNSIMAVESNKNEQETSAETA